MGAMQKVLPEMQAFEKKENPINILGLLNIALTNQAGIDVIERLAALAEKAEAKHSEVEFHDALNRCQSSIARVAPDLTNPQTRSKYASYAAIDKVIRPIYTKEGFSLSFDTDVSPKGEEWIRVLCYVSRTGHTRTYKIDMPADGKGAKGGDVMTKTHATGAADSYGKRYLVKDIFNIAIGEDDNDGNHGEQMTEEAFEEYAENIKSASSADELKKAFGDAWKVAGSIHDGRAQAAFQAIYDARKKAVR